jgi:hypothetical protein
LRPASRLFRRSAELLDRFPADYEGITLTAVTAMAISTAETIEITSFNANPWHPAHAPQLRPPHC